MHNNGGIAYIASCILILIFILYIIDVNGKSHKHKEHANVKRIKAVNLYSQLVMYAEFLTYDH